MSNPTPRNEPDSEPKKSGTSTSVIGSYRIIEAIGKGGMGTVYKAEHMRLKRVVALKVLPRKHASNPLLLARFRREATAASQLQHPNIIAIYDQGEWNGRYYIALEYADGEDLLSLIRKRGKLPVRRAIEITKQSLEGLQHAHQRGIVHRDIKPSNLLIRKDGVVQLADLGLALHADEDTESGVTRTGTTVGTVDYMSPEQARGSEDIDVRSDLYSLGCSLFHMLAGHPPFPGGTTTEKLLKHAKSIPPDIRHENSEIPESLVAVLNRMMAKQPENRYQTPRELLNELTHLPLKNTSNTRSDLLAMEDEDETCIPPQNENVKPSQPKTTFKSKKNRNKKEVQSTPTRSISFEPFREQWKIITITGSLLSIAALLIFLAVQYSNSGVSAPQNGTSGLKRRLELLDESHVITPSSDTSTNQDTHESTEFREFGLGRSFDQNQKASLQANPIPEVNLSLVLEPARSRDAYAPSWYTTDSSTDHPERLITIQRYGVINGSSTFRDLQQAFLSITPGQSVTVEIRDNGPFYLSPLQIQHGKHVTLRAAMGYEPILIFDPSDDETTHVLLSIDKTHVSLENLHFVAAPSPAPSHSPFCFIEAKTSSVTIRNCSFTIPENFSRTHSEKSSTNPIIGAGEILRPDQTSSSPSSEKTEPLLLPSFIRIPANHEASEMCQFVVTNTLISGPKLSPFLIERNHIDLVLDNSLLISDRAIILGSSKPLNQIVSQQRTLRMISSTLITNSPVFQFLELPSDREDTAIRILLLDSILANQTGSSHPLFITGSDKNLTHDGPIRFETHNSHFLGWRQLIPHTRTGRTRVQSSDQWLQFWKVEQPQIHIDDSTPFKKIRPNSWISSNDLLTQTAPSHPENNQAEPSNNELPVSLYDPDTTSPVGIHRSQIARPPQHIQALAFSSFPVPEFHSRSTWNQTSETSTGHHEEVDLDKSRIDLGEFISEHVSSQTLFVTIRGTGKHFFSPIRVRDHSLHLRFLSSKGGEPLTLIPRSQRGIDAHIDIRNGNLKIDGARFEFTRSQSATPSWMIRVEQGNLSLNKCWIKSPIRRSETFHGLISWSGSKKSESEISTTERSCSISNSFLFSSNRILKTEMAHKALFLAHSALVSLSHVFDFQPASPGHLNGTVQLRNCTLLGRDTIFLLSPADFQRKSVIPLKIFATESIFSSAPGSPKSSLSASLLNCSSNLLSNSQLIWKGKRNVYAHLARFLTTEHSVEESTPNFQQDWIKTWGQIHEIQGWFEPQSIWEQRPTIRDLKPSDFLLAKRIRSSLSHAGVDPAQLPRSYAASSTKSKKRRKTIINF